MCIPTFVKSWWVKARSYISQSRAPFELLSWVLEHTKDDETETLINQSAVPEKWNVDL